MLRSATGPWFLTTGCDPSQFTDLIWKLRRELGPSVLVVQLRGRKMTTEQNLYDELSAALQFPYYFGENWDALDECIADLSWFAFDAVVLCILEVNSVLEGAPQELAQFTSILSRAAEAWAMPVCKGDDWDRPAIPFHIILQTASAKESGGLLPLDLRQSDLAKLCIP